MPNSSTHDPKIQKIARINNKRNGQYLEVIRFALPTGEFREIELPPSTVADPTAFAKALRDSGAILPGDYKPILLKAAAVLPKKEWVYEAHTGWTSDQNNYVLCDRSIGPDKRIKGIQPAEFSLSGNPRRRGSVQGWNKTVASVASGSSLMMCALCSAFAGPLLSIIGQESFGICIFGKTRKGKTVTTLAAGSVIGIGEKTNLLSWRLTNSNLEERLPEFNDSIFVIDDLQGLRESDRYGRIREFAYMLAQGQGTGRHSSYVKKHGGEHNQWRSIILTSAEYSISDLARKANTERQGGELLRLIDLPSVDDANETVFDRSPARSEAAFERRMEKLIEACKANQGVPFIAFVESLLKRKNLERFVRKRVDYFFGRAVGANDGPISRDIARKFAVLYAAGCLASAAEIVSWSRTEIRDAVLTCFHRARRLIRDDRVLLEEGLLIVERRLQTLPVFGKQSKSKFDFDYCENIAGFTKTNDNGRQVSLLKRDDFENLFSSRQQAHLVESALLANRRLTCAKLKRGSHTEAKKQHRWPDGERRRSLEIERSND
jgi:uncharacterized protein (DUF927 family)